MLDIIDSQSLKLPANPHLWLQQLKHPTVIEIAGEESQRWRVVSVLIHGNEPSGFFAAFEFIKQNIKPRTNMAIIISSVRAARHSPEFTHRYMPGEFDLNRRFGLLNCHDNVTELARQLTEYIRNKCPEHIVDLHNTSGSGPSFAVSISDHESVRKMASLFTRRMVVTQLIVGSLMEQNFNCPVVTIECGGAQDKESHKVAFEGLCAFAQVDNITLLDPGLIELFVHPVRVKAQQGISLDYNEAADNDVDITLRRDIERFNFGITPARTPIAWLNRCMNDCMEVINDQGENVTHQLFEMQDNQLLLKTDLRIFMATGRADIALSDCLFYAVTL